MPLLYYQNGEAWKFMHEETREMLEFLLEMNAKNGESATIKYIKENYIKQVKKSIDNLIIKCYYKRSYSLKMDKLYYIS